MKLKPTMTQGEIPLTIRDRETGKMVPNPDYPKDLVCKTGHTVPYGTRFFAVSGQVVSKQRQGIYCEFCLTVANKISHLSKQGLPVTFDPQEELQRLMAEAQKEGN